MSFCAALCLPALEAERVFAVLSFLMAVSTGALCLVFALCWTSQTVRSYSNTRSLLMAGQALYPTTLLLLTMASTGNATATLKICKKKKKENPLLLPVFSRFTLLIIYLVGVLEVLYSLAVKQ